MEFESILIKIKNTLKQNDIDEREARLLLAYSLNCNKEDLFKIEDISEEEYNKVMEVVKRRVSRSAVCIYYWN